MTARVDAFEEHLSGVRGVLADRLDDLGASPALTRSLRRHVRRRGDLALVRERYWFAEGVRSLLVEAGVVDRPPPAHIDWHMIRFENSPQWLTSRVLSSVLFEASVPRGWARTPIRSDALFYVLEPVETPDRLLIGCRVYGSLADGLVRAHTRSLHDDPGMLRLARWLERLLYGPPVG